MQDYKEILKAIYIFHQNEEKLCFLMSDIISMMYVLLYYFCASEGPSLF